MKVPPLICQACGKQTNRLVVHHWYELPNLEIRTREICNSCNMILKSYRFYPRSFYREHKNSLHHILPTWEKQMETLQLLRSLPVIPSKRDTVILTIRIKKGLLPRINQAFAKSKLTSRNAWLIRAIKEGIRSHAKREEGKPETPACPHN